MRDWPGGTGWSALRAAVFVIRRLVGILRGIFRVSLRFLGGLLRLVLRGLSLTLLILAWLPLLLILILSLLSLRLLILALALLPLALRSCSSREAHRQRKGPGCTKAMV